MLPHPEQHFVLTRLHLRLSPDEVEPVSGSVKGRQHDRVPSGDPASSVIVWLVSWLEHKQRRLELWSQEEFNPGAVKTTEGRRRHLAVLFSSAAAEEPHLSLLLRRLRAAPRNQLAICIKEKASVLLRWRQERSHVQASFKKT